MTKSTRVMVIGLDGATWDVLDPWIRDGTLPHLARLRDEGSWGVLRSTIPPITAAAWSTFMTGKRPGKHGVYHFINLFGSDNNAQGRHNSELVSARSLKSPALWDVLGHHDRRVVLINIPLTYPPRPVNGVMVTGLLTPRNAPVFTYPAELSKEITDYKIDLDRFVDKRPFVDEISGESVVPSLELVAEFRDMLEKRAKVTFSLMKSQPWDFSMVVFIGTDRMGHYLWKYQAGLPDERTESRALALAVRDYYIRLDEIVGDLVSRAGDDVTTLIMSDHGMGPEQNKRVHINNWLLEHGWLKPTSPSGVFTNPDNWIRRLGLSRDKIGRVIHRLPGLANSPLVKKATAAAAIQVDTVHSQAVAIPIFNHIFGIRINARADEKPGFSSEIALALSELIDPQTGVKLVGQIYHGSDYYQGPYTDNVPDLIVLMHTDYGAGFRLGRYSSLVTELQVPSDRGNHRMEGIFLARGPQIARQADPLPDLDIEDVAPTALSLMGLPVPVDMDGRVLGEILTPESQARSVERGPASDFWTNAQAEGYQDVVMSREDEAEIMDRLQALGYIE